MRVLILFYVSVLFLFVRAVQALDLCGLKTCPEEQHKVTYADDWFLDAIFGVGGLVLLMLIATLWRAAQRQKIPFGTYLAQTLRSALSGKQLVASLILPVCCYLALAASDAPQVTGALTLLVSIPLLLLLLGLPALLADGTQMMVSTICFLLAAVGGMAGIVLLAHSEKEHAETGLLLIIVTGIMSIPFVMRRVVTQGLTPKEAVLKWLGWGRAAATISVVLLILLAAIAAVTPFLLMPRLG
jgi:hypothetical protein